MEKNKYFVLLLVMFVTLLCYSQTGVQSRDVKRISGKAYLLSKGNQYEIREGVVLAKLKKGKKQEKTNTYSYEGKNECSNGSFVHII